MHTVSDAQAELDLQAKDAKRHLTGTVIMGLMAACLAFVGQSALAQARPLFDFIDIAYGAWQSGFHWMLWAVALAWFVALIQGSMRYQDITEQLRVQQRLDDQYARAQQAREAAEERRAERAAVRKAEEDPPPRKFSKNARSNKFDY
ncbi:hypothetical protein [Pseudoduganella sp. RAF53_2]|uniref:hypothetical protein n=1 Tax=unclassified Pseudoduganella TaxID=2637179 RepID=UPI003F9C8519